MRTKLTTAIIVLILAAVALAACGGDSDSTSAGSDTGTYRSSGYGGSGSGNATSAADTETNGGATVKVVADSSGGPAFTKSEIDAPAGQDTIEFDNPSTTDHNVFVEDSGGNVVAETDTISDGRTSAPADLRPGTYTFYCGIPGHREAGMEGTLTVN